MSRVKAGSVTRSRHKNYQREIDEIKAKLKMLREATNPES